jgi:chromate transporter
MMLELFAALYWTFLKIGTFAFGGGLAVLTLIEREVVGGHAWLSAEQFVELVALSEMTPGPIAVNAATFVGVAVAGVPGGIMATLGVATMSMILMTLLARVLMRIKDHPLTRAFFLGMRPVVAGWVACAALSVGQAAVLSTPAAVLAVMGFFAVGKFKVHPICVIVCAAVAGLLLF